MKPSYLIDRIKNIFPDIRTEEYDVDGQMPETAAGALRYIIRHSDDAEAGETLDAVRKLLSKMGYGRQLRSINFGQNYVNSSKICLQILYALYMERIWWRVCPSLSGMLSASSSIS